MLQFTSNAKSMLTMIFFKTLKVSAILCKWLVNKSKATRINTKWVNIKTKQDLWFRDCSWDYFWGVTSCYVHSKSYFLKKENESLQIRVLSFFKLYVWRDKPSRSFNPRDFTGQRGCDFFFKYNLPKNVQDLLDLNGLELSQSSFISENLKEEQTDLLFQIPLKSGEKTNVYLLFEHKSYLDDSVFSQLLGYISAIYKSQYKADKKYSVVIPFVFYHGERSWTLGSDFKDRFVFRKTKKKYLKNTFLILNWNFLICLKWI